MQRLVHKINVQLSLLKTKLTRITVLKWSNLKKSWHQILSCRVFFFNFHQEVNSCLRNAKNQLQLFMCFWRYKKFDRLLKRWVKRFEDNELWIKVENLLLLSKQCEWKRLYFTTLVIVSDKTCKILGKILARSCKIMHYSCRKMQDSSKKSLIRTNLARFLQET